jgi:flavin-dependent dehydrogenase
MRAAGGLHGLNFFPMHLAFQCGRLAGRIVGPTDQAKAYYEVYEQLIRESQWSADALNRNRGAILTAVEALRKGNAAFLADDLKQQFDQALAPKGPPIASLGSTR